ncbi:Mba1p KNAG_0A03570 [Huiozyma naganishii CBS 8797]|uniref:Uncharacterized protein n=1 Tax=Huiozyma naganishii (strain ATCC MYA-139 / BCRC 22969 / CBS 8797 / KCTC 17520 / NBRC 10181 / NCYC 3082 / Yp74L-3) TaxID=1071383 RepID=J7REQ8_HUIN7|nr:hypothetical protein KNAG_0A03570 [Kazachstania naganishii CBS 8797]CCK68038.1 hypothetical protein KNAG_0A03570 [Kazachstania naganishii CBS 8797]
MRSVMLKSRALPRILNVQSTLLLREFNKARLFSTGRAVYQAEKTKKTKKQQDFNPKYMGVGNKIFIPTSYNNLPNLFFHPLIVLKALIRRIYTFGLNTFKIGIFRFQTGVKPNFLLWKNKAIESYIQVNKAFVNRDVDSVRRQVSLWVEDSLTTRVKMLPKNLVLEWQILKFNGPPRLVALEPIMAPGQPLEYLQLVYKFDTEQELIKLNTVTKETEKQLKNVIDYMVFLCDTTTNDLYLSGSI